MPPESSTPTGTSATIRRSTATRRAPSSASCQSRSLRRLLGSRVKAGGQYSARVLVPSGSTTRTVAGGSFRTPARIVRGGGHDGVERHVVGQRDRVDARCRRRRRRAARAASRRTAAARASGEVERLDAEPVAGQHQPPGRVLDDREGEHAEEVVDAVRAPLRVRLEDDLGVGGGEEPVARGPRARRAAPGSCRCSR